MTYITSVCSSTMENVQKTRALPMKTRIDQIPIKRTPKTKTCREERLLLNEYLRQYAKTNPSYRETHRLKCQQWPQNPKNKEIRNVRQRLRRYKVKLNIQLINIWLQRGLITIQSDSKVHNSVTVPIGI